MLGALAEQRFDAVLPTVQRVEDALRVQQSHLAVGLLTAADRGDIVRILTRQPLSGAPIWFSRWRDLFARGDGSVASPTDLETIHSETPVLGWAAANALRPFRLCGVQMKDFRSALQHSSATVRWRVAHALGTHPDPRNLNALRAAVLEEPAWSWVAYGALRAEFEQLSALLSTERRDVVASMVDDVADKLRDPGHLRSRAIRCLDVEPLPDNWHHDLEPLLALLWETADARGAAELASLAERSRRRKSPIDAAGASRRRPAANPARLGGPDVRGGLDSHGPRASYRPD